MLTRLLIYVVPLIAVMLYFMLDNRETNLEFGKARVEYAETSDFLSSCKIISQRDNFFLEDARCTLFVKQDKICEVFPERDPLCASFLAEEDYDLNRNFCHDFSTRMKRCEQMVTERLWYAPIKDFVWGETMTDLSQWSGYDLSSFMRELFAYFGINLVGKWYNYIGNLGDEVDSIYIGTVAPVGKEEIFYQGVDLARKEINAQGGILGRQLKVKRIKSDDTEDNARAISKELVRSIEVVAIITRQNSSLTKPLTLIYEQSNLVNLILSATNLNIIRPNMKYNFRVIPNNVRMAAASAAYCQSIGCQRVAIIMGRDSYSQELGQSFYDEALKIGIRTAYMKSFFESRRDFTDIIVEVLESGADAIYFGGWAASAADFAHQRRRLELNVPLIGTDSLDNSQFIELASEAGEGTVVPSIYNERLQHTENVVFTEAFRKEYGRYPGTWSAQGYDATKLLAWGIKEAESTEPLKVASALRYMDPTNPWRGAGGQFLFSKSGELKGRDIFFKRLEMGEYKTIPNQIFTPQIQTDIQPDVEPLPLPTEAEAELPVAAPNSPPAPAATPQEPPRSEVKPPESPKLTASPPPETEAKKLPKEGGKPKPP